MMLPHPIFIPEFIKISGTKGSALKYPVPGRIANGGEDWLSEQEVKALGEKYQPEIVKKGWRIG